MSDAINAALAFCMSTYIAPKGDENKIVVSSTKRAKSVSVAKSSGEQSAPANKTKAPVVVITFDFPAGTLNARQFMSARNKVKPGDRDGIIQVIAAYIGYDLTEPFGIQDSNAVAQAKREINPPVALKAPFSRGSIASVQGFVAGEPDHREKAYQNLLARERLAANTMLDHEKAARDAKTQNERTLYEGLALVERERLVQIRKDLL